MPHLEHGTSSSADTDARGGANEHKRSNAGLRARILSRRVVVDVGALTGMTAAVAGVYVWTKAPLYNPPGTIDPWLYTALWSNFDQIYGAFNQTYYASRLPWIVPGYVVNSLLDPRTSSLVIHTVFFLGGGVLFYVLCRRWFGTLAAAIGYLALVGSQMYFNAHRWDYQEGAVLTYMIAALSFSLPRARSRRLRAASLILGGFFSVAMVTTRVIDVAYLVGLPILYAAVATDLPRVVRTKQVARDIAAFATGAILLLLGGGLTARSAGGEFFFFMPQIRVVLSTTGGYNQIPVDEWLPAAPYVFVPPFVALFGVVALAAAPNGDRVARRLLVASTTWLALVFTAFAAWQFLGDGWLLNLGYYFSSFLVPTIFCFSAAVRVLLGPTIAVGRAIAIFAVCAICCTGPVIWIYRRDSFGRIASDYGDIAFVVVLVAIAAAVLLAGASRRETLRPAGAAAVAVAVFAIAMGIDASETTFAFGASDRRTGGLYDVSHQTVDYLSRHGKPGRLPTFWYDSSDGEGVLDSIQSMYFWAYTRVDGRMPHVTPAFRSQMQRVEPDELVLLCTTTRCEDGERALRRSGFAPRRRSETAIESDGVRVRVQLYDVNTDG